MAFHKISFLLLVSPLASGIWNAILIWRFRDKEEFLCAELLYYNHEFHGAVAATRAWEPGPDPSELDWGLPLTGVRDGSGLGWGCWKHQLEQPVLVCWWHSSGSTANRGQRYFSTQHTGSHPNPLQHCHPSMALKYHENGCGKNVFINVV